LKYFLFGASVPGRNIPMIGLIIENAVTMMPSTACAVLSGFLTKPYAK